ncbi:glycosyltransferase family 2 protein [Truepera radiovictrix]|uniref:Glycosyl transferase family 2 n=1 Tax=Truepera radiovictrix (strain DSM 17093 / CIP 108686 / LMG 22925 / RQ-24) TaxID=649638 RepID=D7CVP5_TRURR|nr:glycosyltransferase family 2 protein [Truepera radiovictrix]ADI15956.1 glycosyl transferase family 2 [Truepera radiovictrix DSM 17093]WMT58418.1 glycosyltransferase family 2 protein [Truepera radiovictrix]
MTPAPPAYPLVYIVLVNWNGWRDTDACLASLKALDYPNARVVVVDNASTDGSVAELQRRHPDLTLLPSGANLGFAGGNNVGLRYALEQGADYVWLLNNDTLVEPDALTHLVARAQAGAAGLPVGLCGSTLIYESRRDTVQALGGARYNRWWGTVAHIGRHRPRELPIDAAAVERQLDYLIGASMLVSRPFLETIGLMQEDYFLYFEELDWAVRARGRFALAYAPQSVVYHKEGASIGGNDRARAAKSFTADRYALQNRVRFTRRFYPYALPTVYLGLGVALINRVRRRQWDRVGLIARILLRGGEIV